MGLGMILFWGLIIAAIVVGLRALWGGSVAPGQKQEKSALELLKERYARGEIERDEFEQKKRDLSA